HLSDGFLPAARHEFDRIRAHLLDENDEFLTLKDLPGLCAALADIGAAYLDEDRWTRMSLVNIARSGRFSSDLTIRKYADEIWRVRTT
ncbi:MAG TPA: glycogen/starch/alpha-glucan phosphorylase, partial [Bacillota bacterium]|nr:glycogen/starch/alpha-glucan phosphorylase [Bacillota bacterium]